MKRILVFIGLKIAEIGGIVFMPYWLGKFWTRVGVMDPDINIVLIWLGGFSATVVALLIPFLILLLLGSFIKFNWDWAEELTKGR